VRRLAAVFPQWQFIVVDMRGHGLSARAPGPHTLHAAAEDVESLARAIRVSPHVVLGHSFGGKARPARPAAAALRGAGYRGWAGGSCVGGGGGGGGGSVEGR